MIVNELIRNAFSLFGLDVRLKRNLERNRYQEAIDKWSWQWNLLSHYGVRTLLDIGANEGQFASMIRGVCPSARILSFEPLPACFCALEAVVKEIGNAACFNIGIGAENGIREMFMSSSTPSSSMLPMGRMHKEEWPDSSENKPVSVKVQRLDDVVDVSDLKKPIAVKIDVQGLEDKVISGAEETFRQAAIVVIETSFVPLYEGQPLFKDIYEQMTGLGFTYQGALDTSRNKEANLILQEDSVFINPDKLDVQRPLT